MFYLAWPRIGLDSDLGLNIINISYENNYFEDFVTNMFGDLF